MPRLNRALMDYSYYHIITRGVRKQTVFRDDIDFINYLKIAKRAKKKFKILVYAYCLMANHVHMLVETETSKNMSKFMHSLNRTYAEYFNTKYDSAGHLWQGRYISKPILNSQYLLDCVYYIETNPLRASLVASISDYKWSSYNERCLSTHDVILDDIKGDI